MKNDINKRQRENTLIVNTLVWIIILCIPYLSSVAGIRIGGFPDYLLLLRLPVTVITVYYVNYYFLVERFLTREKSWIFICCNIALILLATVFERATSFPLSTMPVPDRDVPPEPAFGAMVPRPIHFQLVNILLYVCAMGAAVAFRMIRWWYEEEEKKKEQEHRHVKSELQNLKNQLNPHFLFNTLNNIYSFIGTDVDKARRAMDSLCDLLRYALYRSEKPEVPFSEEVAFVRDYVELASERLPEDAELSVDLPESPSDTGVAPMLFITLIENAFKHGIEPGRNSFIHISLKEKAGRISCRVENSCRDRGAGKEPDTGGIGLENMQKRLELIYGGHYVFRHGPEKDNTYSASLEIDII